MKQLRGWHTRGNGWGLYTPCLEFLSDRELPFHFILGSVLPRKDGRFDWWRRPGNLVDMGRVDPRWTVPTYQQGVALTLDLAKHEVEKGFALPGKNA